MLCSYQFVCWLFTAQGLCKNVVNNNVPIRNKGHCTPFAPKQHQQCHLLGINILLHGLILAYHMDKCLSCLITIRTSWIMMYPSEIRVIVRPAPQTTPTMSSPWHVQLHGSKHTYYMDKCLSCLITIRTSWMMCPSETRTIVHPAPPPPPPPPNNNNNNVISLAWTYNYMDRYLGLHTIWTNAYRIL